MRTWKTRVIVCAARVLALCFLGASLFGSGAAWAEENWQKEFAEICSKTQDAMSFTPEELKVLIQRCDALVPQIEKLEESQRKVYLRRLNQCRGLFVYVLESKEKENKEKK